MHDIFFHRLIRSDDETEARSRARAILIEWHESHEVHRVFVQAPPTSREEWDCASPLVPWDSQARPDAVEGCRRPRRCRALILPPGTGGQHGFPCS